MIEDLTRHLQDYETKDYALRSFDCMTFTNECWTILYGNPWCPNAEELYNADGTFSDLALSIGMPDVLTAVPHYLKDDTTKGSVGSLVFLKMPQSKPMAGGFGISLGDKSVFIGSKGLVYLPTKIVEKSWIN